MLFPLPLVPLSKGRKGRQPPSYFSGAEMLSALSSPLSNSYILQLLLSLTRKRYALTLNHAIVGWAGKAQPAIDTNLYIDIVH